MYLRKQSCLQTLIRSCMTNFEYTLHPERLDSKRFFVFFRKFPRLLRNVTGLENIFDLVERDVGARVDWVRGPQRASSL